MSAAPQSGTPPGDKETPRNAGSVEGREEGRINGRDSSAPPAVSPQPFSLAILEAAKGAPLTKRFALDANGQLEAIPQTMPASGRVRIERLANLGGFARMLGELRPSQALTFGLPTKAPAQFVAQAALAKHPKAIARDRGHFAWPPGASVLFLDHDAGHAREAITSPEALRDRLIALCPALASAPMLITASASTFIENSATGETLRGAGGWHVYVPVRHGTDIARAGRVLFERSWLVGHGRYAVTKSGRCVERSIIDAAVWQPERVDFAVGAHCAAPLVQRRPPPVLFNADAAPFDTAAIEELTPEELAQLAAIKARAKAEVSAEAQAQRAAYIEERGQELVASRGLPIDEARKIARAAVERQTLLGAFLLTTATGEVVSVAELLNDPQTWHGRRFCDPLEPDYRGDSRIAYANLCSGGAPHVFSHAHGGQRFELLRQVEVLRLNVGREAETGDDTLAVLRDRGGLYVRGRYVVRIIEGRPVTVTPDWLTDEIGRLIHFQRYDERRKGLVSARVPADLSRRILAREGAWNLPRLRAVVTAPTLREDGTVLDRPGYDAASGILFLCDELNPPTVPAAPSDEQAREAVCELWGPLSEFPWCDDVSRAVAFAALLTAVARPALPTAPAFAFDAPAAGSGKTLAARTVAALAGVTPTLRPPPDSDEEMRKALFATLRAAEPVAIFDNVIHPIEGAALCGALTAPFYSDRVLGVSETETVENRTLLLLTGNNLRATGDAARRVAVARMDPALERPFLRRFDFDPPSFVAARRLRLVAAALTVLRWYQRREPLLGPPADGSLASFEQWDATVRQTVAALGELGVRGFADPALALTAQADNDPTLAVVVGVMDAWEAEIGRMQLTAREAYQRAYEGLDATGGELGRALNEIHGGDRRFDARRLGLWFMTHRGRVVTGRRFASRMDGYRKVQLWRLEKA
jgi:hypothetical protein